MGNYCCIASKHQQKAKHNKYKYKDDHQQQLNDLYDRKLLPITNNNNHNKSSLYNSDKTKLKNLYNNNNNLKNDSASILLLSNTSSTVSSVTLSTNTLSEQSTTTTLTNISNNNNTNYKTRGETHLIPLLKLNQIIIESSSQLDEPIISKELYNINENEDENQEKHSPTANITTTTSPLQQRQQVTPLSNKFILNKTVNSKKLSQRKRTSYLNQSLNETDRDLTKTYQYVGRRLLNDDYDEHNNSSSGEILDIKEEAEEHNKPDANNETKTTDALNLFNWKNYKSLQKSKRSIKNLEETIQNSRSIEQWLNDFSKLKLFDGLRKKQQQQQQDGLKQQSLNAINKIDEETITSRSITNKRRLSNCVSITLDDNDDEKESKISQLLPPTLASNNNLITDDLDEFNLILNKERCNNELNLNHFLNEIEKRKQPQSSTRLFSTVNKQLLKLLNEQQHEQEMSFKLTNLLLPKSLANSEDIDMLKWLLTNNQLRLVSFNNELTFTNDHLVLTQQNNMDFLLIANKLNIDLEENDCNNESIITDDDNDDDILVESLVDKLDKLNESYSAYMKYNSLTGCLKLNKNLIEKLLNKEKDLILKLSQTTNAACLLVSSSTSSTTTADLSSSSINPTTDSTNSSTTNTPTIIDKYRKYILDTCNFKGAQILMNIKKKQILNRKCSSTQFNNNINNNNNNQMNVNNNNNKLKSELNKKKIKNNAKNNNKQQQVQYLSPTPLVCTPISDNNCSISSSSGTTSPSSASSVSPASSSTISTSSYNNHQMPLNPISTPISISTTSSSSSSTSSSSSSSSSTPSILLMTTTNASNDYSIKYNDLNERLFSCLLSNFSCQLVDQFLATQFHTGFIRKQKENKSFTFINIFNNNNNINNNNNNETDLMNESDNSAHNRLDLTIDKQNIKLCLKLNKWPLKYKLNYFERKRSKMWPNKSILDYLETKTCLITCSTQNESQWQLDTQLAELYLFKSLNKHQKFQFYFIYNIYMQMSVSLGEKTKHLLKMSKLNMYQLVNERMFKHHYFRFIELETLENEKSTSSEESNKQQANLYLIQLLTQIKKFISYMKNQLNEYKTFNSPNYFDLNKSILNDFDYSILLNKNLINVIGNENDYCCLNNDLMQALNQFEASLNNCLISKLNTKKSTSLQNNLTLFNSFLDLIQFKVASSTTTSPTNDHRDLKCLQPAHYSADNYLHEYVYEFAAALFEQFKSKRDKFQISEHLMLELHDSILASKKVYDELNEQDENENDEQETSEENRFLNAIKHLNRDSLFDKFEEYAECVHKYLPQIRHNNQYLLFHYIWTMQVQYMAPFFNYLCDFYPIID